MPIGKYNAAHLRRGKEDKHRKGIPTMTARRVAEDLASIQAGTNIRGSWREPSRN
jgi:hypothetical protein